MSFPPIQCITVDDRSLRPLDQVIRLCDAGAKWIQLRMKRAEDAELEAAANAALPHCRAAGARLILNDRVEIAQRVGADGVHLGKHDMPWQAARDILGDDALVGGTVNSVEDARHAAASDCLDYVGVGPFRFTRTKDNLAPVLTPAQWDEILAILHPLPAYAIGGILPADIPALRERGVHGVAVAGALVHNCRIAENYRALATQFEPIRSPEERPAKEPAL